MRHCPRRCKDQWGNPAHPGSSMSFEMALLPVVEGGHEGTGKEKKDKAERKTIDDRWKSASVHPSVAVWHEGECEVRYTGEVAGNLELHAWCVHDGGHGTREALPGSPFPIHFQAGRAHAHGSSVDSFTRLDPNAEQGARAGAAARAAASAAQMSAKPGAPLQRRSKAREALGSYEKSSDVFAGEPISVRSRRRGMHAARARVSPPSSCHARGCTHAPTRVAHSWHIRAPGAPQDPRQARQQHGGA